MANNELYYEILSGNKPEYAAFAIDGNDTHDVIKVKRDAASAIANLMESLKKASDEVDQLKAVISRGKRAW